MVIHFTPYRQIGGKIRNLALTECSIPTAGKAHSSLASDVTCKNCRRSAKWKQDNTEM